MGTSPPTSSGLLCAIAKCHMSRGGVTVPQKPSLGEREAVFTGAQTVRLMFVLPPAHGERIPAGRGEGERSRRRIPAADKEFSTSPIGICRFKHVGRV